MITRLARLAALGAAVALGAAACGGDNSSSSVATTTATTATTAATTTTAAGPGGTTSGSASVELCQARSDLQTSIKGLGSIDVVKNGTSGITDALTKVKADLAAVRSAGRTDLDPQITAFSDAISKLETAVSNPGGGALVGALGTVVQTGTSLLTALGNLSCS